MKLSPVLCAIAGSTLALASMSSFAERGDRADLRSQHLEQRSERVIQNGDSRQGQGGRVEAQRWQQAPSRGTHRGEIAQDFRRHDGRGQGERSYGYVQGYAQPAYVQPGYVGPQYYAAQPLYVQPGYQAGYDPNAQPAYEDSGYVQPGYFGGDDEGQSSDAAVGAILGALLGQALGGR